MINVKKLVLFIDTVRKAVIFLDRSVYTCTDMNRRPGPDDLSS